MRNSQKDFHKKLLGKVGEKKAVAFLKEKGYKIVKTNYETPLGEIDVIAKLDDTLVFVEVKTRTTSVYGFPSEAVDYKKRAKYIRIAKSFLAFDKEYGNNPDACCRFDVIEILDGEINHVENAFCE